MLEAHLMPRERLNHHSKLRRNARGEGEPTNELSCSKTALRSMTSWRRIGELETGGILGAATDHNPVKSKDGSRSHLLFA